MMTNKECVFHILMMMSMMQQTSAFQPCLCWSNSTVKKKNIKQNQL